MKPFILLAVCLSILLGTTPTSASDTTPDKFPRKAVTIDGKKVYHVTHMNRHWREARVSILQAKAVYTHEVCFRAKFGRFEKGRLKLFKMPGAIRCDKDGLIHFMKSIQPGNNIWVCGFLGKNLSGKGLILDLMDICLLKGDDEMFKEELKLRKARGEVEPLLELGHEIKAALKTYGYTFGEQEKLVVIQRDAFTTGLKLLEKNEPPDTAEKLYQMAVKWRDLVNATHIFNQYIRKVLKMDPDHDKAGEIALLQMGMVKYAGTWMSPAERDALRNKKPTDGKQLGQAKE